MKRKIRRIMLGGLGSTMAGCVGWLKGYSVTDWIIRPAIRADKRTRVGSGFGPYGVYDRFLKDNRMGVPS